MSGTGDAGAPPPEVPEEFAAAYRAAYEQAMTTPTPAVGNHRAEPTPPADAAPLRLRGRLDQLRHSRWLLVALSVVLAVILVLGAYLLGRVLGHDDTGTAGSAAGRGAGKGAERPSNGKQARKTQKAARAWRGPVRPVTPTAASASCTAKPGVDSAGHRVSYGVDQVLDADPTTAWRCDGPGRGMTLEFTLPAGTRIGEVGLIPGYAKTDPKSHADRYAQNNRITQVRWTIGDTVVTQRMSGDAHDRSMRTMRVPRTRASTVTLEIRKTEQGPRDTTCVSGVRLGRAS